MTDELQEAFRAAMAGLAGGVCVVTTTDDEDEPRGFAATSVTSLSLHPPLLAVSQSRGSSSHDVFRDCAHFGVSVLAREQRELADRFATSGADRFTGTGFRHGRHGCPLHPEALAEVECARRDTVDAGDHVLLIGEVCAVRTRAGDPLVYQDRRYHRLAPA